MEETEDKDSDAELYETTEEEESSDDERGWVKEVKKQHKIINRHKRQEEDDNERDNEEKVYEFDKAPRNTNIIKSITRVSKASLGDRLTKEGFTTMVTGTGGNREMKFRMGGKKTREESDNYKKMRKHHQERKEIARKTGFLAKKKFQKRF